MLLYKLCVFLVVIASTLDFWLYTKYGNEIPSSSSFLYVMAGVVGTIGCAIGFLAVVSDALSLFI